MSNISCFKEQLAKCLDLANEKYNIYEIVHNTCNTKTIDISYYIVGKTAGIAKAKYSFDNFKSLHLKFNSYLIETSLDVMTKEIIPHEIAHLVVYLTYPRDVHKNVHHGKIWKDICVDLGGTGARYHYEKTLTNKKKTKYFEYNVNGNIALLPEKDHKKAQRSFHNFYVNKQMVRVYKDMYLNSITYR